MVALCICLGLLLLTLHYNIEHEEQTKLRWELCKTL